MSRASQAVFQGVSLLLTQHRVAEARVELERLLALEPEDPEVRAQAADVYAYIGAQAEAYRHYQWAAEAYNRQGHADLALAVHHKMLELDPAGLDSAAQTRLRLLASLVAAEDALVAEQWERAVACYSEAIRAFPNHTISYQRLASLLVRLNRVEEAAAQYLTVARAFYVHGMRGKARPYFERVLELQPWDAEAMDALLDCLKAEGRGADGARHVRAGVQALIQAGRTAEARGFLTRFGPAVTAYASAAPAAAGGASAQAPGPLGAAPVPPSAAAVPVPPSPPPPLSASEQAAWRSLGEACLAQGLFEEARWIFGRLAAARPTYPVYAEFLRRAEAGQAEPPRPASGEAPFPLPLVAAPVPASAPAFPASVPAEPVQQPWSPPALAAGAVPAAPGGRAPAPVRAGSAGFSPWPVPAPRRPAAPPTPRFSGLEPTAHAFSLGAAPASDGGALDDSDALIE